MTILADVCAGSRRDKITNVPHAHSAFTRVMAAVNKGRPLETNGPKGADTSLSVQLVTASIPVINSKAIPLSNLVKLRQQDRSSDLLPTLRASYRAAVEKASEGLYGASDEDRLDAISTFRKTMAYDLRALRKDLRLAGAIPLIVVAGALVTAPFSAPLALGAAAITGLGLLPKFSIDRRSTLQKHPAAYLYLASAPRFQKW
jgi:hypothetical protein